jgi:formylglycine-generating enzyme required for sulfatase activity
MFQQRHLILACAVFAGALAVCGGCGDDDGGSSTAPPTSGTVVVTPGPTTLAISWTLRGPGGFSESGTGARTYPSRSLGSYTLTWGAVENWVRPSPSTVTLKLEAGGRVEFTGLYRENLPSTIVVDATPDGAGSAWVLNGPDGYRHAGAGDLTLNDLDSGVYTLSWLPRSGWWLPVVNPQTQDVFGGTTTFAGAYREDLPAPAGYRFVPDGTFTMGSPAGEWGRLNEEIQREITLTRGVFASRSEITRTAFCTLLNWAYHQGHCIVDTLIVDDIPEFHVYDNLDGSAIELLNLNATTLSFSATADSFRILLSDAGTYPVGGVNWYGAAAYCDWLSLRQGLPRAYDHATWALAAGSQVATAGYRLPTEAEWEYLCRAGAATAFCSGPLLNPECVDPNLDLVGWSCMPVVMRVEQKQPSAWGLYDMHGNVAEWCQDVSGPYAAGAAIDPLADGAGALRVVRGGNYANPAHVCRSARRSAMYPGTGVVSVGLRPVRTSLPG